MGTCGWPQMLIHCWLQSWRSSNLFQENQANILTKCMWNIYQLKLCKQFALERKETVAALLCLRQSLSFYVWLSKRVGNSERRLVHLSFVCPVHFKFGQT